MLNVFNLLDRVVATSKTSEPAAVYKVGTPFTVAIAEIKIRPEAIIDAADLGQLQADIERNGQLIPIVVDGDRQVVDGHRRLEAAKRSGATTIKATHLESGDASGARLLMNAHRTDLPPIEVARLLFDCQERTGLDDRELGAKFNRARNTVNQMVRVAKDLPRLREEFGEHLHAVPLRDLIAVVQSPQDDDRNATVERIRHKLRAPTSKRRKPKVLKTIASLKSHLERGLGAVAEFDSRKIEAHAEELSDLLTVLGRLQQSVSKLLADLAAKSAPVTNQTASVANAPASGQDLVPLAPFQQLDGCRRVTPIDAPVSFTVRKVVMTPRHMAQSPTSRAATQEKNCGKALRRNSTSNPARLRIG